MIVGTNRRESLLFSGELYGLSPKKKEEADKLRNEAG
jgi:hypothetical protein